MNIKVRTGSNLRAVLKSTVNIPQAFTELVKNSLQNDAAFCQISLFDNYAIIEDNGIGLSAKRDESGLNSFEKYFTYGNSYDQMEGKGLRLGQMGIGGKVANDKLSHSENTHWQIETKDLSGDCYLVDYRPPKTDFLDDYSPLISKIDPEDCTIKSLSGTKITIKTLAQEVQTDGWKEQEIRSELQSFFGILVQKLKEDGLSFDLIFQGKSINFDYKLPGQPINFQESFDYQLLNKDSISETKTALVDFRLSYVRNAQDLRNFHQKTIDLVSDVKVCSLSFSIFPEKSRCQQIAKELGHDKFEYHLLQKYFNSLIGFISCKNIIEDIDFSNNNAKDLSHHNLRLDHSLTAPLYSCIGEALLRWIITFDLADNSFSASAVEALTAKMSEFILDFIGQDELLDIMEDFGLEYDAYEHVTVQKLAKLSELGSMAVDSALKTQESLYNKQRDRNKEENASAFFPKNQAWQETVLELTKVKKSIPFEVVDFEEHETYLMSKLDPFFKFKVLINSKNPKYISFFEETNPIMMSLYVSELLIREIVFFTTDDGSVHKTLDLKISQFYEKSFSRIKKISDGDE